MRFFKYLIFILLSIISVNSFAALQYSPDNQNWFSTPQAACNTFVGKSNQYGQVYSSASVLPDSNMCSLKDSKGNQIGASSLATRQEQTTCKSGETAFLDGYITSQTGFAPDSVCHSGCVYNSDGGGTAFDTPNGNLSWGINATKTGETCSTDTPKGEDTPNGSGGDGGDGGSGSGGGSGSDGGCTETGSTANCNGGSGGGGGAGAGGGAGGGGGGSGGKGGDGGAGGAGGQGGKGGDVTINMTPVVNAINSMSSAIVNKLTSVSSQITGAISDMKTSITDAIGITNSKVQAVKDEVASQGQQTRSEIAKNTAAVNSIKQSVDANTQAVNDMKSAVNQQTKAINDVKAAVDANTTAIGAVKSAVDAVASKIDKAAADTVEAVNASANKITSAISADGNATRQAINADGEATRKTMTEQGNATRSAINANGQKITDAVKQNTEETKKTNSLLEDLKEWLTGEEHSENTDGAVDVVEQNIDTNFKSDYLNASASCPAPLRIEMKLLQTHIIEYKYDTFCSAASMARPWIIFVGMLVAFLIVTGQYRGGASD